MRKTIATGICCVALAVSPFGRGGEAAAQTVTDADSGRSSSASAALVAEAVRVAEAPVVDGRLDDAAWASAPVLAGLVQREPEQGVPARDATEVRIVYDASAIYVGARMSGDPAEIRADVTRRDVSAGAEELVISLDTYRDGRTAYTLVVTAAGSRIDYYHSSDSETNRDYSFDPVWQARTTRDDGGWTAEVRIPLSQLRFSPGADQVWGLNVVRVRPAIQEEAYWALVGREQTGWSSRMGELRGLSGLDAGRRVELQPYVASSATLASGTDGDDPFADPSTAALRGGADVKVGLGSNLTLDATFNPDFGQVEADPAVVNLSAFEVFFDERRPFFTEGAGLFSVGDLFYSRRIGAPPHGDPSADYVEELDNTTILAASKLTGRLPSGLSIGVLGALTQEEVVRIYDEGTDTFGEAVVEPMTGYGVLRMDQQFGAAGSNVGFIVTGVGRAQGDHPELSDILADQAFSGAIDGRYRWAGGMYDINFRLSGTSVHGSPDALVRLQHSSRRYFQRPDADHVQVDSAMTSMQGYAVDLGHSRNSGDHWLWDVDFWMESPGYEPNDLGRLSSTDGIGGYAGMTYRETTPGRLFRNWAIELMNAQEWNYGGTHTSSWYGLNMRGTLANFWYAEFGIDYEPPVLSHTMTRGGPLMETTGFFGPFAGFETRSGRDVQLGFWAGGGTDRLGGWGYWISPDFSYRPSPRLELSFEPEYNRNFEPRQYVTTLDNGRAATFGSRYVFSNLDYSELAARMRVNYAIGPDLTLETYLEPFVSSGDYHDFGELARPEDSDLLFYGNDGTTIVERSDGDYDVTDGASTFVVPGRDFNVRSFRSNVVLRWEWRPGSTLFLVWQQDRAGAGEAGRMVRPGDLGRSLSAAGDNFLAVKMTYWLPL